MIARDFLLLESKKDKSARKIKVQESMRAYEMVVLEIMKVGCASEQETCWCMRA